MNVFDREYNRFDVAVIEGRDANPMHRIIYQRTCTWWTHCVMFTGEEDKIWDPTIGGILDRRISHYAGRKVSVHRIKGLKDRIFFEADIIDAEAWLDKTISECAGYDYAALFGFLLGKKSFQYDNRWYCAELPYRFFQRIEQLKLTRVDLAFVYPSFFYESNDFYQIYEFTDQAPDKPFYNSDAIMLQIPHGTDMTGECATS